MFQLHVSEHNLCGPGGLWRCHRCHLIVDDLELISTLFQNGWQVEETCGYSIVLESWAI